jgi:hypothetical protein
MTAATVTASFADGSTREVPEPVFADLAGLDALGNLVVTSDWDPGYHYSLTPCCHASGKGSADSPTGVVCRSCYRDVDLYFGGPSGVTVALA